MRILYHHRTRAEDAQGIHIYEMVNAFRKLGHEVKISAVISEDKKGGMAKAEKSFASRFAANMPPVGYELLEILYNAYGYRLLMRDAKKFRPDFIYERYALYNISGILVSKTLGIPLILEVNAPLAREKKKYGGLTMPSLAEKFEKWICSNSHKTIVVSTPLKKIMQDVGVPEDRMVVIHNAINPDLFNLDISGKDIKDRYGLNGKIVLGFVGWFRKWHGLEELLKAYVEHRMKENNIALLLVGDGPAFRDLETYAAANGVMGSDVVFTGSVPREEIPRYIAAFDLALQPDVTDYASPIKMFEYMAMGKGVIAPDKENIKEIVKADYPALFRAGDWKHMTEVILQYSQSKEYTSQLGKQAGDITYEHGYFWTENARRTVTLLEH